MKLNSRQIINKKIDKEFEEFTIKNSHNSFTNIIYGKGTHILFDKS